ncbi:hypothetical protein A2U01_0065272, partial [Trifolium medium]|nr:hypothetical protein [Trifolium medium]
MVVEARPGGWLYRAGRLHVAYPSRHCSYGRRNRLDLAQI